MTGVSRRALLRGLVATPLVAGCGGSAADPLALAAGEPGGFYVEFGELLAGALRTSGTPVSVVGTGGSVQNIERLRDGAAALGLALTDIALAARNGEEPFGTPVPLQAIGRVYENYMQLVVRVESPATSTADLAGRDRKSTRLNSSHLAVSRMPSSA